MRGSRPVHVSRGPSSLQTSEWRVPFSFYPTILRTTPWLGALTFRERSLLVGGSGPSLCEYQRLSLTYRGQPLRGFSVSRSGRTDLFRVRLQEGISEDRTYSQFRAYRHLFLCCR